MRIGEIMYVKHMTASLPPGAQQMAPLLLLHYLSPLEEDAYHVSRSFPLGSLPASLSSYLQDIFAVHPISGPPAY